MKRLFLLTCALALVVSASGVAQVSAGPFGTDITIYDKSKQGTYPNWRNRGENPGEDQEVEPNAITGQRWDMEGFQLQGNSLSIIAGFDLANGTNPNVGPQLLGSLFLKVGPTPPAYGLPANAGTDDNHNVWFNNAILPNGGQWNYDYAVVFTSFNPGGVNASTYDVYQALPGSQVIMHGISGGMNTMEESNPWKILDSTWNKILANQTFTYLTGLNDAQAGYNGLDPDGNTYPHNVIQGVNLAFLGAYVNNFWAHITMDCGNDNLMGHVVPIPGAWLLLGSGLVGLAGLRLRRK